MPNHPLWYSVPFHVCPHCLGDIDLALPVEPLYDLNVAAEIIPMPYTALQAYLETHRLPRRYRKDPQKRLRRLLTAREVRKIRGDVLVYKHDDGSLRLPDDHGN